MTEKDRKCLENMLDFTERVHRRICDTSYQEFSADRDKQDMVLYALGQIGENASCISDAFKEAHKEISWTAIIGIRNRIFHIYNNINMKLIFDIASNSTSELIQRLKEISKKYGLTHFNGN